MDCWDVTGGRPTELPCADGIVAVPQDLDPTTFLDVRAATCIDMCVDMCVDMCIYMCVDMRADSLKSQTYLDACVFLRAGEGKCTCTHARVRTCTHRCTHTCMCAHGQMLVQRLPLARRYTVCCKGHPKLHRYCNLFCVHATSTLLNACILHLFVTVTALPHTSQQLSTLSYRRPTVTWLSNFTRLEAAQRLRSCCTATAQALTGAAQIQHMHCTQTLHSGYTDTAATQLLHRHCTGTAHPQPRGGGRRFCCQRFCSAMRCWRRYLAISSSSATTKSSSIPAQNLK